MHFSEMRQKNIWSLTSVYKAIQDIKYPLE